MNDKFLEQLKLLNIDLDHEKQEKFHQFYKLLVEWNKVMNLTAITDYDDVYEKHFIDSLAVAKVIDLCKVG